MTAKIHDVAKLPKWAQQTIAYLQNKRMVPAVIGSGQRQDAERQISEYLSMGFELHTFIHAGKMNIGGGGEYTAEFVDKYTWVLINPNHA